MANISKIKVLDGTTYNLKDSISGYVTANHTQSSSSITLPSYTNGTSDVGIRSLFNNNRANRLAFLPADQIIIEKTVDGGATWTDAEVSDANKRQLFSETRGYTLNIPLDPITKVKSNSCGVRVTITGMKYDVPVGTAETEKYNFWNANYIKSAERYCNLFGMYFWVSSNTDCIGVKVERATGGNSTSWNEIFNSDAKSWKGLTGWSGNDFISFGQSTFGGGTNQTGNFWNYRITFFSRPATFNGNYATTYTTSQQQIFEIRGYGDTWWTKPNNYMANDHIYTWDYNLNVTFPANVTATNFYGKATSAGTADKLGVNAGSGTQPIYFENGVPKVTTYSLGKSVPSDAKFTDTTYSSLSAVSGGTDVSLVTTGEKYIWGNKQDSLISGTNIKTINNESILGSGNIVISGGGGGAVSSVNGKTGDVTLTASDVGARPSTWTPTKSDVGLGNVGNFKAVSTVASQGLTDTEKSNARANIGAGTYSKPSGGIPKTDLASAVQTSLGKADTAIQSLAGYATTEYVDNLVGDIESALIALR